MNVMLAVIYSLFYRQSEALLHFFCIRFDADIEVGTGTTCTALNKISHGHMSCNSLLKYQYELFCSNSKKKRNIKRRQNILFIKTVQFKNIVASTRCSSSSTANTIYCGKSVLCCTWTCLIKTKINLNKQRPFGFCFIRVLHISV